MLLLLCPDFAHKIARDGIDVPRMQRMLLEWTRAPIERWHRAHWRKLEQRGYVEGNTVPLARDPGQFLIAVAGGESGAPRALLLHVRAHLVGEQALRARRGVRRR